jgi:hypothetical protein
MAAETVVVSALTVYDTEMWQNMVSVYIDLKYDCIKITLCGWYIWKFTASCNTVYSQGNAARRTQV